MKHNRDFKGVWIPKNVYLATDLSWTEKILIIEIDSLDQDNKGCFASNEYLAGFLGISTGRCANIISSLRKRGIIYSTGFDGRSRKMHIDFTKVLSQDSQESEGSLNENVNTGFTKTLSQDSQKREHSNTSNNTHNNTFIKVEQKQVLPPTDESLEDDLVLNPPKRKKKERLVLNWPASFTETVIKEMNQYVQMRKEIGHPIKSQTSFSRMCNDCEKILVDYGESVLIHSIGEAIKNGWRSIHPKQLNGTYKPALQKIAPTEQETRDKLMTLRMDLLNLRLLRPEWNSLPVDEQIKVMQQVYDNHKNQKK